MSAGRGRPRKADLTIWWARADGTSAEITANLRIMILDIRGFGSNIFLKFKGWNSQAHREFPGKSGSSNLGREVLNKEIGTESRSRQIRSWTAEV